MFRFLSSFSKTRSSAARVPTKRLGIDLLSISHALIRRSRPNGVEWLFGFSGEWFLKSEPSVMRIGYFGWKINPSPACIMGSNRRFDELYAACAIFDRRMV